MAYDPEKHKRYYAYYRPNDYYWGIGIENESYFQFSTPQTLTNTAIYNNHKAERYSVNYFLTMHQDYKDLLKQSYPNPTHALPIYINSHTFQRTDVSGNHMTTYERVPKPNPKFRGQTIHAMLEAADPEVFKSRYLTNYVYDGDTIEFITQNFYKTTVNQVITELVNEKQLHLAALNRVFAEKQMYPRHLPIIYPTRNEPFVSFLTNINNITTFNNGTYHLNFTLPTQLDDNNKPADMHQFVTQHKNAIRYIQALEPFMIATYGTPDPFAHLSPKYSKASQRCAVSRYIGIGTYNTDVMETGKVLVIDISSIPIYQEPWWWYNAYHKNSNYLPLPKIGVDINFQKHGAHGIEIRIFDWFPETYLNKLMTTLVHLFDYSLINPFPCNPILSPLWNSTVVKCLTDGKSATLTPDEYNYFKQIFNLDESRSQGQSQSKAEYTLEGLYDQIEAELNKTNGICSALMLSNTIIEDHV